LAQVVSEGFPDRRVLYIDCGQYPGRASSECVATALSKLKIEQQQYDVVKQNPIIILMLNYQNIGTYDSVYAQNRLNSWNDLKLIVTCRGDYFRNRGYLKCFLPDPSNRRYDDLLVSDVPAFASAKAKKVVFNPSPIEITLKQQAQLIELTSFLTNLREIWIENGDLKASQLQNAQIFISYAWEKEEVALIRQQYHLARLAHDLTVGFPTWIDIE
jgi:hypothetical protein